MNNFCFISGHGTCDAENCLCPDGRTFDEDWTIWEIVRKSKVHSSNLSDRYVFFFRFSANIAELKVST